MESGTASVEVSVKFENKHSNPGEAMPMSVLTNKLMQNSRDPNSQSGSGSDPQCDQLIINRDSSCNSSGKSKTCISVRSSYLSVGNHTPI